MTVSTTSDKAEAQASRRLTYLHLVGKTIGWPIFFVLFIIALAAAQIILGRSWIAPAIILTLAIVIVVRTRKLRWFAALTIALLAGAIIWRSLQTPSSDRDWAEELSVMPRASLDGTILTIENLRNFNWRSSTDYDPRWETRSYDLENLQAIDMIVQPFPYSDLMAHTMLSFDFGTDGRLLLSIEARKEKGEPYGAIPGVLAQFELIYLFMDERDAFGIRAGQGHSFIAYPTRTDPLWRKAFLLGLCTTSNSLAHRPRFYNTLRDNCTTEWLRAVDKLSGRFIGVQIDTVLNGRIGRLMHREGAIDTDLPYEQARRFFRIDHRVLQNIHDPRFSELIRLPDQP